jgi:hypothetical protein
MWYDFVEWWENKLLQILHFVLIFVLPTAAIALFVALIVGLLGEIPR